MLGFKPKIIIGPQSWRERLRSSIYKALYDQHGAINNEAWFIHGVNETVVWLAQQKIRKTRGAFWTQEGVVGKTWPFQRMGSLEMEDVTTRDTQTTYLNPDQTKRRAVLLDARAAVTLDSFDKVRELINPESIYTQALAYARERKIDKRILNVPGLGVAGAAGTAIGGVLGLATTVNEAAESTSTVALPTTQQIVDGGTGMTMDKILDTKQKMDEANVEEDDRYFFYSPRAMRKLLTVTQVTSADYSTINALMGGGYPMDGVWMGFKWRQSTQLPIVGNIRSCIAAQKMAVGVAIGLIDDIHVARNEAMWGDWHAIIKLSIGVVRVDDLGVVQVNIDESV